MSEIVERVARAIDPVAFIKLEASEKLKWEKRVNIYRNRVGDARKLARAAIEAMREPTTAMLAAAQTAWLADPAKRSSTLWQAMIDGALK